MLFYILQKNAIFNNHLRNKNLFIFYFSSSVSVLSTTIQHMFANKSAPQETTKKIETTIYYLFYKTEKKSIHIGAHLKTIKYCVKCLKKLSPLYCPILKLLPEIFFVKIFAEFIQHKKTHTQKHTTQKH